MDAGTVLLATSDLPGLEWFSGLLDKGRPSLLPNLVQGPDELVAAVCFETTYDTLQAVERLLAAAPGDGVDVSLALVTFGRNNRVDPVDASEAATVARCLLAATPRGGATTCGSAAMVAGPLLSPAFGLVWTEDIVRGPVNYERVFRIVAHGREAAGAGRSPCLEWARRYAAEPLAAGRRLDSDSAVARPRLTIARTDNCSTPDSEIARLALQAHARGDAVLRADGRPGEGEPKVQGGGHGRIALLELMAKQLTQHSSAGSVGWAHPDRAPGFACLDHLEALLRTMARRIPTTLVVPELASLDEISRVVIERLLQDSSLAGFSLITSQRGEDMPEELRQLMSRVSRTETVQLLVS